MLVQLFAVQTYERTRLTETLFFTEWDDAVSAAVHKEPSESAGIDYTLIAEFEVDEELIEDIGIDYAEGLMELFEKSTITNHHYFIQYEDN
jgi:hypothetical protein